MTFKEKLLQEHPEYVRQCYGGGCKGCPAYYGYELRTEKCQVANPLKCTACWNREMPEITPESSDYSKGLGAFAKAMRVLCLMEQDDKLAVFGTTLLIEILDRFSVEEIVQKLEKYENSLIKVGEIVRIDTYFTPVVTKVKGNQLTLLYADGSLGVGFRTEVERTGETVDLDSIFAKLKEDK